MFLCIRDCDVAGSSRSISGPAFPRCQVNIGRYVAKWAFISFQWLGAWTRHAMLFICDNMLCWMWQPTHTRLYYGYEWISTLRVFLDNLYSLRNRKPLWLVLPASSAARGSRSVGFIRSRRRREVARFSAPQWREEQPITAAVTSRHSTNQRPRCRHSGPGRECRRGTWNRSPGCQMLYVWYNEIFPYKPYASNRKYKNIFTRKIFVAYSRKIFSTYYRKNRVM